MIFRASRIFRLRGRTGFGSVASFDEARWTRTPPAKTEQVGGGDGDKPSVPIRSSARRASPLTFGQKKNDRGMVDKGMKTPMPSSYSCVLIPLSNI